MGKVIIFGNRDLAELAHFYLSTDSIHEVVAFSVNREYLPEIPVFKGLPVIEFEEIEKLYDPHEFSFFAPMTHFDMNRQREKIYQQIKKKGYKLINYLSSKSIIFDNVKIGENCFILEANTVQPFVNIGNDVVLWSGNHIGHHSIIKDHVFFTSHVVLSGNCVVESNCFLGVNSATKENLLLSEGTFVAMGTCLTKSTEPYSVYSGNPAKKIEMSSLDLRF
jgi:sugar O-acyltransferase (sialic acid O-acetyltransferase NeuD family)